ncbi:hypothetical protein HK096_001666, partial [Nowakowskiella sp. JEL0078]
MKRRNKAQAAQVINIENIQPTSSETTIKDIDTDSPLSPKRKQISSFVHSFATLHNKMENGKNTSYYQCNLCEFEYKAE